MKKTRADRTDTAKDVEGIDPDMEKSSGISAQDAGDESRRIRQEENAASGQDPDDSRTKPSIEKLEAEVAALEDALLRAKADYQNLQRRTAREGAESVRYANAELMKSLLTVLDDFDRSLEAANNSDAPADIVDGVCLVRQNLIKALQDHGLSQIPALHEPFDPKVHEAVMMQPCQDFPDKTVIGEIARGYRLMDRVILPAKVVVSKGADQQQAKLEDQAETERKTGGERERETTA